MECVPEQQLLVFKARESKREKIQRLFENNLGQQYGSTFLHELFGSSFRTRVSEINRGDSSIRIRNRIQVLGNGKECSEYWSEKR